MEMAGKPAVGSTAFASEAPEIMPFWQRLPLFFRYPWHWQPLTYMLFLSAATLLGVILPLPPPFSFLIVFFGVWLAFVRYAYKTLEQTSYGRLEPSRHEIFDDPERNSLPYKQLGIFFVIGFVIVLTERMGGLVFGVVLIFAVLALPASVINLTITRSFLAGLNPLGAIHLIRTIGLPYLGLCAFLFLLSASQQSLLYFLLSRLPSWLLLPAMNFVSMYFTLIMFNMMGYVVYQHHHLLGLEVVEPAASGKVGSAAETAAAKIGGLIGEGRLDEALEIAYEAQRAAPDDVSAHERYHKLLALAGKNERLLLHARPYLSLLLQKNRDGEALPLYRAMHERDTAFEPEQPAQLLRLAVAARRGREYGEALALLKGFDKRFPRHPEIPAVYLFAARVLSENLHQDVAANQLLKALLARYPEHPAATEARPLLKAIERLAAQ